MKTITRKYTVYTFDELSKEAQEKAINDWRIDDDLPFMPDDMQWKLEELLKKNGFKGENVNVQYSLSSCQGDGASFTGVFYWKGYVATVTHSFRYVHKYSTNIDVQTIYGNEAKKEARDHFTETYMGICDELESYGYDYMEDQWSTEAMRDTFEANDYTFTSDGKIFS